MDFPVPDAISSVPLGRFEHVADVSTKLTGNVSTVAPLLATTRLPRLSASETTPITVTTNRAHLTLPVFEFGDGVEHRPIGLSQVNARVLLRCLLVCNARRYTPRLDNEIFSFTDDESLARENLTTMRILRRHFLPRGMAFRCLVGVALAAVAMRQGAALVEFIDLRQRAYPLDR